MTSSVEFRVLGPVEVRVAGRPVPLGGPRQRAVLGALLLHANSAVGSHTLLRLVWTDTPKSACSNLRTYLTRLRRALHVPGEPESRLRNGAHGYAVTVRPGELDLADFTAHAAQGERAADAGAASAHLARALAAWRGPALADVATGPLFDTEATRLEAHREHVRERLLRVRLALGQHAELVPELRALLAGDPLAEDRAALLMLALHRCGRRAEALDVYRRTRTALVHATGLEPGPELRALHTRLLADDHTLAPAALAVAQPTLAPRLPAAQGFPVADACHDTVPGARATAPGTPAPLPAEPTLVRSAVPGRAAGTPAAPKAPAQLPAEPEPFVGRAAELAELTANRRVVVVDGMVGVGKTALVVRAAHLLAPRHPDGLLFVDLNGSTPRVPPLRAAEVLVHLLRSLGVPESAIPPGIGARAALWRSTVADRRVVVVLDDAHSAEQVEPLLSGAGASRVLVTSRRRLPRLGQAHPLSLDVLTPPDAAELFRAVSGRQAGPDAQVDAIVTVCGGLPLAVRAAADRLRDRPTWSVLHLVHRLLDERGLLAELDAGAPTLVPALAESRAALRGDHRRMLDLLGLHLGDDVRASAAAALAEVSVSTADRLLEDLVDARLLRQSAPGHYQLHVLVRAFVRSRACDLDRPSVRRALHRLLDHHLAQAV